MAGTVTIAVHRPTVVLTLGRVPTSDGGVTLGPDLTALEALTDTGVARRSAADTWTLDPATTVGLAVLGAADAAAARTTLGLVIGTNVAAYDAGLASLAGVDTGADLLPYTTGAASWAGASLTAAGRALLDDADAAAQRTTLGLVIGTNVAAYDAGLASLAGVDTGADLLPYTTGAASWAGASLTAAGRALLDDADAAAQRTTLGLVIGTNVAAYDAGLASLAGVDTGADLLPYTTGAASWAGASLTAAGRALLDDADAAAQRTTLGLVIGTNVAAYDAGLASLAGVDTGADLLPYTTGAASWAGASLTAAGRALLDDADAAAQRSTLGLEHYTVLTLAADVTNSTTTLASVSDLSFTPAPGGIYHIEYVLGYVAAATTTGIQHWLAPGNAADGGGWFAARGAGYTSQVVAAPTLTGSFPAFGTSSGSGMTMAWGEAVLVGAASSPTACGVEFATEIAASGVTLKANCCLLRYRRIA